MHSLKCQKTDSLPYSGKTLAFGIPALARLVSTPLLDTTKKKKSKYSHSVSVLVLAPTRELALQTHDALSALGAPFDIASVAVFGGVDKAPQVNALKNANNDGKTTRIVVGTPGRILDLVNEGACDLSRCVTTFKILLAILIPVSKTESTTSFWTRRIGCLTKVSRTIFARSSRIRCKELIVRP